MQLSTIYLFVTITFGSLALISEVYKIDRSQKQKIDVLCFIPVIIFSFLMPWRSGGIDYDTYVSSFQQVNYPVPDIGYRAIETLIRILGGDFFHIVLLTFAIQIIAFYNLSRQFKINLTAIFFIYFLHLYVVRDLSQLRVALSVYLVMVFMGSLDWRLRYVGYFLGFSVHFTSLIFSIFYEIVFFKSQKLIFAIFAIILFMILLNPTSFLKFFYFVDPRIELYLIWEDSPYSQPVENYYFLALHLSFFIPILIMKDLLKDETIKQLAILQLLGLLIFICFRDLGIFAARLGNMVTSLYPIFIILVFRRFFVNSVYGFNKIIFMAYFILIFIVLVYRSYKVDVIDSVIF